MRATYGDEIHIQLKSKSILIHKFSLDRLSTPNPKCSKIQNDFNSEMKTQVKSSAPDFMSQVAVH